MRHFQSLNMVSSHISKIQFWNETLQLLNKMDDNEGVKGKRGSHIRHVRFYSRAAAAPANPHQQRLQQNGDCAVHILVSFATGQYPCGWISDMQHSTTQYINAEKTHFSLLLSPLQALPKPPVDLQGTSLIRGSKTNSLDCL